MCACTEPVRTGIGAVCVEYGRPKWPITMLNHTDIPGTENVFIFYFWHPMLVRPAMKRLFCLRQKTASVASLPQPCLIKRRTPRAVFLAHEKALFYLLILRLNSSKDVRRRATVKQSGSQGRPSRHFHPSRQIVPNPR